MASSLFFIFYAPTCLYTLCCCKQVLPILKLTAISFLVKHQSCYGFQLISALLLIYVFFIFLGLVWGFSVLVFRQMFLSR